MRTHTDMQQGITQARLVDAATAPGVFDAIAVIDLGGQYCHMIARRLRDLGIASAIFGHTVSSRDLAGFRGIILSGGPQSVYKGGPKIDKRVLDLRIPILGVCYGHQLLAKMLGCNVSQSASEYGKAHLELLTPDPLFKNTPRSQTVWMSHGDSVRAPSEDMRVIASTGSCGVAAFTHKKRRIWGVQFHPEVVHTLHGRIVLENFARDICDIRHRETPGDIVGQVADDVRKQVGNNRSVLFFVSGGVDSTVAFVLCAKALPRERVLGVYVDTGLMRKNETEELQSMLSPLGLSDRLIVRPEADRFLSELKGITDPEDKRKIIGRLFIDVQNDVMREIGVNAEHWMLGQGTIYPDTVESGGAALTTALIKTHHNRCEEVLSLIAEGKVIEPLAQFYKDEVRKIGELLGLDKRLTSRWPFPGPGLAIRCLCWRGSTESVDPLPLPKGFEEYAGVRFPIETVGVQGDARTYCNAAAVSGPLDYDRLQALSTEICNSSRKLNRVIVLVAGDPDQLARASVREEDLKPERIELLRKADHTMRVIMEKHNLLGTVWQFPTIMIPVSYAAGESIVLRPVCSEDGMTADFGRLPVPVLREIGEAICRIQGIDAVFLDATNKPPATIEWE